ncbi:MAG: SWIM zinc finger family protein [Chloroflexi bacterium]|nr:SWIM zinc finger family protein [Chloroflexota bacterium]
MTSDYAWWERHGPRLPSYGIKAQTRRGAFGKTWWASRWIAALENLVNEGRLARGRTYARNGQVTSLDVDRDGVRAVVQGSRPEPYEVTITFKRLSDAEWDRVVDAMAAEALYAARLLSGEMPEQIEEVFAAAGTSLFPTTASDMRSTCSCPDMANPCKHIAAVHYLLGERFDEDPFLIFLLRGRSRDEIVAALRARRAGPAKRSRCTLPCLSPTRSRSNGSAHRRSCAIRQRSPRSWSASTSKSASMPCCWRSATATRTRWRNRKTGVTPFVKRTRIQARGA